MKISLLKVKLMTVLSYLILSTLLIVNGQGQKIPDQSIFGQVVDLFGNPLEGAKVKVLSNSSQQAVEMFTDKNGNYLFNELPYKDVAITVELRGFKEAIAKISLSSAEKKQVDFGLVVGDLSYFPPLEINGNVQQESKTAVRDATIVVLSPFNPNLIWRTKADKNGNFKILIDFPGKYIIYALKSGFSMDVNIVVLPAKLPRKPLLISLVLRPNS